MFAGAADEITIRNNFNKRENGWTEPEFKDYPILIFVTHDQGRNKDKESRHQYLKRSVPRIGDFVFLKAEIAEFS